jgi:hypothetical protein
LLIGFPEGDQVLYAPEPIRHVAEERERPRVHAAAAAVRPRPPPGTDAPDLNCTRERTQTLSTATQPPTMC